MPESCGLKIGSEVDKEAVSEVSYAIDRVFRSAHEYRMDQETVRTALEQVGRLGGTQGVNVSNSNFSAGARY